MNKKYVLLLILLFSCTQGLSEEEAAELVAEAVANAVSEATSTTTSSTTTTSTTTTSTTTTTTTTIPSAETQIPEIWNLNIEANNSNLTLKFELKLPEDFTDEEFTNFADELNYWGIQFPICNTQKINYWEDNPFPSAVGPDKIYYEQDLCASSSEFVGFASTYSGLYAEPVVKICPIEKFSQIPKIQVNKTDNFTIQVSAPLWRVSRFLCGITFDSEVLNKRIELDPMFAIDSYDRWNDRPFPSNGNWWIVLDNISIYLPFYGENCTMTISFSESMTLKRTSEYNTLKKLPKNTYLYSACDYRVLNWMKYGQESELILGTAGDGEYFYKPESEVLSGDDFAIAIKAEINKIWNSELFPANSISTSSSYVNYHDNPKDPDGLKQFQSYNISFYQIPGYKLGR